MNPLKHGTGVNCMIINCFDFVCRYDHVTGKEYSFKPNKVLCPHEWEVTCKPNK
jgi:hypothetical protein